MNNITYRNQGYAQGWVDGQANVLDNLDIEYTYHEHKGTPNTVGGCYGKQLTKVACGHKLIFPGWDENVICCENSDKLGGTCKWYYTSAKVSTVENAWNTSYSKLKTCSNQLDKYVIAPVCGKTTETIESVTIKY